MKTLFLTALVMGVSILSYSQQSYSDSIHAYINEYVKDHEVVTGENKKLFQFFPADESYRVKAKFEKAKNPQWFQLESSGKEKKTYRVYGTLSFTLNNTPVKLNLYQSQSLMQDPEFKDYLLLPFTDGTSGNETYQSGRYLDFKTSDIKNNTLVLDFNKAYNPYCAYEADKYNCPMPPKENAIPIEIKAGEKNFAKKLN